MKFHVTIASDYEALNKGLYATLWVHEFNIKKLLDIVRACDGFARVDYDYSAGENNAQEGEGDKDDE